LALGIPPVFGEPTAIPNPIAPAEWRGPTYWFVRLDLALQEGDWVEVADAAEALRRLGIDIRLRLNRVARVEAGDAEA
jgi:hypothetical protein